MAQYQIGIAYLFGKLSNDVTPLCLLLVEATIASWMSRDLPPELAEEYRRYMHIANKHVEVPYLL